MVTASHNKHLPEYKQQLCVIQGCAVGWLFDTAMPIYKPSRHDFQQALNKVSSSNHRKDYQFNSIY